METLADRAAQSLSHHPSPALPLEELTEQVRGGGTVVGSAVLLRALEARPDLFRVLDPWRGPWRSAAPRPDPRRGDGASRCAVGAVSTRWVVPLGRAPFDRDPKARLKASVVHLGRTLDERSVTDLVRWLGMVREMTRTISGEAARPPARAAYPSPRTNQPERQSPSASASTSRKPA